MSTLGAVTQWQRAARRHRALLSAGLTAAAVATALPSLAPAPPRAVQVLAAARELLPGVPLVAADLRRVALPPAAVPTGALTQDAALLGRLLTGPVRRGEPLTDARLVGAGLLAHADGLVAAPVRLADAAEAGLLQAGDRIDVLGTPAAGPAGPAGNQVLAVTVAAAVQVLAVPAAGGDGDGALVVVAATPAVASRLAAAAAASRLSVTVLPP